MTTATLAVICKFTVVLLPGCADGGDGFAFGGEVFSEFESAATTVGQPPPLLFKPEHPLVTGFVSDRSPSIPRISCLSSFPEVLKAVIGRVAVSMVNRDLRKHPVVMKPRQAMPEIEFPVDAYLQVTMVCGPQVTRTFSSPPGVPCSTLFWIRFPSEYASGLVVIEKLANPFGGDAVAQFSHRQKRRSAARRGESLLTQRRANPSNLWHESHVAPSR